MILKAVSLSGNHTAVSPGGSLLNGTHWDSAQWINKKMCTLMRGHKMTIMEACAKGPRSTACLGVHNQRRG